MPLTLSDLVQRVERLPFTAVHGRLMFVVGLGALFDAADTFSVGFILPSVSQEFGLVPGQAGLLGSSTLIGFFFGALLGGALSDRLGRRATLMYALAMYTVPTLFAAFAPSFEWLLVCRGLAGVGFGAEIVPLAPYLGELVPARARGRYLGSIGIFAGLGGAVSGIICALVIPTFGWRATQVIFALPIFLVLWWRRALPESPRWLLANGRVEEAEAVMTRIEQQVEERLGHPLPPLVRRAEIPASTPERHRMGQSLLELWGPTSRGTTAAVWLTWSVQTWVAYGFITWVPSLLVADGFTVTRSLVYSTVILAGLVPGNALSTYLSDRMPRAWLLIGFLIAAALAGTVLALTREPLVVMACGFILAGSVNGGAAALLYVYTAELYPTRVRATAVGAASAFGRIAGVFGPIAVAFVFSRAGVAAVFAVLAAALALEVVVLTLFGRATTGRVLEEITAETGPGQRELAVG